MNKKQYNNVIENTLKYEQSAQTEDSLLTARAIFNNMGVALPQGDIKTVYETIKTDDYMGWKSCTMQEAQAAADDGTAAIGISEDRIVVLSANDEEQPVAQTASVMKLDENTSAFAVDGLRYYSYSYGTTSGSTTSSGGSTTIYPPNVLENVILDKPYNPYYPYINIQIAEQYYATLSTYSHELRNDIVFQFTFQEINSLSMYLNMETYKNSTQQEKEQLIQDIISMGQTAISVGAGFVPVVGEYLSGILTGIDILETISGLNKSIVEEDIKNVIACINAFSHYKNGMQAFPKPNNVTYTISLLKQDPLYGRQIKIESSDGLKDLYTLENAAYDMLLATAIANTHQCLIYKIAPRYTYYYEN